MDLSVILTMPSIVPWWLVALAERAHRNVLDARATNHDGLMVLLLTVTAGEAAVNRLLEPLVSGKEWFGTGKKRGGLDFAPTAAKWTRLCRELGIAPPLDEVTEPLASFLKTIGARHALVHYKHSRNTNELVAGPVKTSVASNSDGSIAYVFGAGEGTKLGEADAAISPDAARNYFPTLEKVLRAVLPAYKAKDDSIVLLFNGALDGQVRL
jgi:hypothetical protein